MAKSTFGLRTAECGHTYHGYTSTTPWPYCPECMRVMRIAMRLARLRRDRLLAEVSTRTFKVTKAKRLRIYERDEWTCQLCGDPVDPTLDPGHDMAASLDHIVCRSWGGGNGDDNLRLAHRSCNARRGDEGRWLAANRAVSHA